MSFSLVGLLVTMCVAAILAANAMPSGLQHAEMLQVKAAVRDLGQIRSDLSGYLIACEGNPNLLTGGLSSLPSYSVPTTCTSGPPRSVQGGPLGGLISSAGLNGLVLTATLGGAILPALKGQTVTLTGKVIGSAVQWSCSGPPGMIGPAC